MRGSTRGLGILMVPIALLWPLPAQTASTVPMNLDELTQRADRIFRGTVLGATPGSARIAGADLPIVTYWIRVEEPLKGSFEEAHGVSVVEVRMLDGSGTRPGPSRYRLVIPGLPALRKGHSYLLLTTRPGRSGLSSTVGLGQGTFQVTGSGQTAMARNGMDNVRLFRGMDPEGLPDRGPIPYWKLADRIRRVVEKKGRP